MRKPRDLADYCSRDEAVAFAEGLLARMREVPDGMRLKVSVQVRKWHPDWERKPAEKGR